MGVLINLAVFGVACNTVASGAGPAGGNLWIISIIVNDSKLLFQKNSIKEGYV